MYYNAIRGDESGGELVNTTTVRLRPEVEKALADMATTSRRSKSWLINEALQDYIEHRQADQARWEATLAAMQDVAEGNVVSGKSVHAWLASWGTPDERQPPKVGE